MTYLEWQYSDMAMSKVKELEKEDEKFGSFIFE